MVLELYEHQTACFVTLTYNPEHLPKDGSLVKKHLQHFLNRLRVSIYPRRFRYFCVGEYGDKSWRPHYHLLLYGVSPFESKLIGHQWKYGFVHVGLAERKSMQYIAGYCMKKMTNPKDRRLNGKKPEFTTMSLRPGIGFGVVERITKAYQTEAGRAALAKEGWFSTVVQLDGRTYPLGRYLQAAVQKKLGLDSKEKKAHNRGIMLAEWEKQKGLTVTQVELIRKAHVGQQRKAPLKQRSL